MKRKIKKTFVIFLFNYYIIILFVISISGKNDFNFLYNFCTEKCVNYIVCFTPENLIY